MKKNIVRILEKTKQAARTISNMTIEEKQKILFELAAILETNKIKITAENKKDVLAAKTEHRNASFIDRLTLQDTSFTIMVEQVKQIALAPDYTEEVIEERTLKNGVLLRKIRVPLGVIAVIYEARPNVTIDVFALCLKSGNAVVLRGGSDALHTNRILVKYIHKVLANHFIQKEAATFFDTPDRAIVTELLQENTYIDVVIPRGGYDLVQKVVAESKIPVLYHASGGARIYVDKSANIENAISIIINAKTSRPATCNSVDTVLVDQRIATQFLPELARALQKHTVRIMGDKAVRKIIDAEEVTEKDYETEFLDLNITIKIVTGVVDAINFVTIYTKKHSEGIVAEDKAVIEKFTKEIDAAGIFVNCSTRLHDGGIFELGAEMGVSTGKLHARGPVGLKELTTYKWIAQGQGQIRQ